MPLFSESPLRDLAIPEFMRKFGDLLLPTAEISQFERGLIEATYERIVLGQYERDQLKSIENTARVAFRIMHDGAVRDFMAVLGSFLFNIERLARYLNRSSVARKTAMECLDTDERILHLLLFYKTLYESLMSVLFAPLIVAMATFVSKKNQYKYTIDQEGKVSLAQLERIQYEWSSQKKQLAVGLNNHLRNAFAHDCYRIKDSGYIELWDIDPRSGNYSWGPVTYTQETLTNECEALWRNALGLVNAWVLFIMNNRKIIHNGNFDKNMPIAHEPLRNEEIRELANAVLGGRGFEIIDFQFQSNVLFLALRCQSKGIDQNSEMYTKSGARVRKFIIKMKYYKCPAIEQLMGSLQNLRFQMRQEFEFQASILSEDNKEIGKIQGHTNLLKQYEGKKLPPIEEFRKQLTVDSIGSATTWMLDQSLPIEILDQQ